MLEEAVHAGEVTTLQHDGERGWISNLIETKNALICAAFLARTVVLLLLLLLLFVSLDLLLFVPLDCAVGLIRRICFNARTTDALEDIQQRNK